MKKAILTLALLASTVAFGSTPDASTPWSELSRNSRVIYEMPQFQLSYGWFMTAPSLCVDGDMLRSKKPKQDCTRWTGRDNDRCVDYRMVYPKVAIEGTKERCVRWTGRDQDRCVEWETYEYKLPLSYDIPVYRRVSGGRDGDDMDRSRRGRPLFVKNYTITDCE